MLFRGQPEVEEETGEFDAAGNAKMKRRKADDEHLIRKALLDARLIDAVISLPLNVFYGAGLPACLVILRKQRPPERRDRVLLIYAARHYRELSAQNELRPQDVMRMLVHYHAYGDEAKVPGLVAEHSGRIHKQIDAREEEEVGRLQAEYQPQADKLAALEAEIAAAGNKRKQAKTKTDKTTADSAIMRLEKVREKLVVKLAERDARIAEAHRRAEDDRIAVNTVGDELSALYADRHELIKHAHVVDMTEIEENEFNLNVPRYVDTYEPEARILSAGCIKSAPRNRKIRQIGRARTIEHVGGGGLCKLIASQIPQPIGQRIRCNELRRLIHAIGSRKIANILSLIWRRWVRNFQGYKTLRIGNLRAPGFHDLNPETLFSLKSRRALKMEKLLLLKICLVILVWDLRNLLLFLHDRGPTDVFYTIWHVRTSFGDVLLREWKGQLVGNACRKRSLQSVFWCRSHHQTSKRPLPAS